MGTFIEAVCRPLRFSVVAVSCGALVSGCQTTDTATYVVPSDSCSQYRMPMVQVVQQMEQPISAGVVISSVIVGAAVGYLLTGRAQGAAVGALAGGVTGAAASYLSSRARRNWSRPSILTQAPMRSASRRSATRWSA
jgi:hypothetical protein